MKSVFLDTGDGYFIPKKKLVLILNADLATRSATTRAFLKKMGMQGDEVLPKKGLRLMNSLILTNSHGKDSLYSSPRSSRYLAREAQKK